MKTNKIFEYYLKKGDAKSAMRLKRSFFLQQEPHVRAIRKERKLELLFLKLKQSQ